MNWEAIGAVGEIVGAGAVVATLAYLSIQLRHARRASEAQGTLVTTEMASHWRNMLLQNSDLSDVLAKANAGEPLSDSESIRLYNLSDDLFIMCAVAHADNLFSGSLHDKSGSAEYLMRQFSANPSLVSEWHRLRDFTTLISDDFCKVIDERLAPE